MPFALLFEVLALGATWPNMVGWFGVLAVVVGVFGYVVTAHIKTGTERAS